MSLSFWVDAAALALAAFLGGALGLLVLGTGLRRPMSRRFALFALAVTSWAGVALWLRLAFLTGMGNIRILGELAVLAFACTGPLLLVFAATYVSPPRRAAVAAGWSALAAAAAAGVPLFAHRVVLETVLAANGSVMIRLSPWGMLLGVIPGVPLGWALGLFWCNRQTPRERYLALSALLLLAGMVLDGLLQVSFPLVSITTAASVAVVGFAVVKAQIFNPLRELADDLARRVDDRTRELAKAYDQVDRRVKERTAELTQAIDERERSVRDLRERATRLELLAEIGRKATAILDADDLLGQSVVLVAEAFGYHNVAILLVEDGWVVLRAASLEAAREVVGRVRLRVGVEGITGWVAGTGEAAVVDDVRIDERYRVVVTDVQVRSEMGVPIKLRDRVIGVLDLQSIDVAAFSDTDRATMEIVAGQLAVAIENARSYEAAREELAERRRTEKELRESEQQFRDLSDQSPNMIFINQAGRVVYANRRCETLMGMARERFYDPDFRFLQIIAPEYRSLVAQRFRSHMRGEDVDPYEYDLLTADGRRVHVVITTKLISYRGEPAILGIVTDLSRVKRTERLLAAFNRAAAAMERALTPTQVFGALGDVLRSVDLNTTVLLAAPSRRALRLEYANYDLSGLRRIVAASGIEPDMVEIPLEGSEVLRRCVVERQSLLAEGFEVIREALGSVSVSDTEGLENALIGGVAVFAPLVVEDTVEGVLAVRDEGMGENDVPAVTAFAHQVAASWRKTALVRELEENLAELERTQEQLVQSQKMEAFGKLAGGIAHDFNNLLTAIGGYADLLLQDEEAANRTAHVAEIRRAADQATSLTQQLLAFSRKQMIRPVVLSINDSVHGVANMLRRLIGEDIELVMDLEPELGYVMADPGQIDQVLMNLSLNARDAMPSGGRLVIETRNVELDSPYVHGHGEIPPGSYVLLRVRDTGRGMDAALQRNVFEPFFTTKEQGKGTGLGLATVHGIVHQSAGGVTVDSRVGRGSTFSVYLPRIEQAGVGAGRIREAAAGPAASQGVGAPGAPAALEPGGAVEAAAASGTAGTPAEAGAPETAGSARAPEVGRARGETVLVVEDEVAVRGLVQRILEADGYSVLSASNPADAVLVARQNVSCISLLLTDVVMPGGENGRELADRLADMVPGLKVVFMSGYAEDAIVHRGVLDPEVAFVAKPFSAQELRRRIRQMLGPDSERSGPTET